MIAMNICYFNNTLIYYYIGYESYDTGLTVIEFSSTSFVRFTNTQRGHDLYSTF